MEEQTKFDNLMRDVTNQQIDETSNELISRMEEVLEEENMGTLDDMMTELGTYLDTKNKLDEYLDEDGTLKIPLEVVFSWFSASIKKKREGKR